MKKTCLIPLLLVVFSQLQAQVLLRYDLEEGKNYPTVFEVVQSIHQVIMGSEQNVDSRQTMEMDMKVEEVQDDITDMTVSYTRITLAQTSPVGETYYDSDSAGTEVSEETIGYAALINNGFLVSFNSMGKIERVSGLDAMIGQMIEKMDLRDSLQKAEMIRFVREQFDEEALAAQIQNSLAIFPEEEIKMGDKWIVDQSVIMPFPMEVISTYMLTDYDDKNAYISVNSKIKTDDMSTVGNAEMTMNVEISGEQSGTMKIDRSSGMILESSLIQYVEGTIEMTSPEEMSWPIELRTEVLVTGKF